MQRNRVPHQRTLALEPLLAARACKRRVLAALVPLVLVEAGLCVVGPLAHVAPEHRWPIQPFRASGSAGASLGRRRGAASAARSRRRRRGLAAAFGRDVVSGGRRHAVSKMVDHNGGGAAAAATDAAVVGVMVMMMVMQVSQVCNKPGKAEEKTTLERRDA